MEFASRREEERKKRRNLEASLQYTTFSLPNTRMAAVIPVWENAHSPLERKACSEGEKRMETRAKRRPARRRDTSEMLAWRWGR